MSPGHEPATVEQAEFRSYYGKPILKAPAWKQPDVPLYLFLGGMAGVSASMAALAGPTGRRTLARVSRMTAAGGSMASVVALIHDLGRPERFLNMLRVFKPTSPLSVGSWILAPFSALTGAAAAAEITGTFPRARAVAGAAAALLGPAMTTYTAVLLSDTATPSWHDAYRQLPVLFAGGALTSGAGVALIAAPTEEAGPARRAGLVGTAAELVASRTLEHNLGVVSEPYRTGRAGKLMKAAEVLAATGAGLSVLGRRNRAISALAGTAYLAAGLCTRFGVYNAGVTSAQDPKYVVAPQRDRLAKRENDARGRRRGLKWLSSAGFYESLARLARRSVGKPLRYRASVDDGAE